MWVVLWKWLSRSDFMHRSRGSNFGSVPHILSRRRDRSELEPVCGELACELFFFSLKDSHERSRAFRLASLRLRSPRASTTARSASSLNLLRFRPFQQLAACLAFLSSPDPFLIIRLSIGTLHCLQPGEDLRGFLAILNNNRWQSWANYPSAASASIRPMRNLLRRMLKKHPLTFSGLKSH